MFDCMQRLGAILSCYPTPNLGQHPKTESSINVDDGRPLGACKALVEELDVLAVHLQLQTKHGALLQQSVTGCKVHVEYPGLLKP